MEAEPDEVAVDLSTESKDKPVLFHDIATSNQH